MLPAAVCAGMTLPLLTLALLRSKSMTWPLNSTDTGGSAAALAAAPHNTPVTTIHT